MKHQWHHDTCRGCGAMRTGHGRRGSVAYHMPDGQVLTRAGECPSPAPPKLGAYQRFLLERIATPGPKNWAGCHAGLDALVAKGLATKTAIHVHGHSKYDSYTITDAGRAALARTDGGDDV